MKRKASGGTFLVRAPKSSRGAFGAFIPPRRSALAIAAGAPARRVARNARTAGFTDIERKFADFNVPSKSISQTWAGGEFDPATANSISAVAQGDGESQRDGRVYHIQSVHIKGFIKRAQAEATAAPFDDCYVRFVLVWDTQSNGAQLNAEDVMLAIASGEDVNSWRNLQFSKRFIVLKDKIIKMSMANAQMNEGAVNSFASGGLKQAFKINKSFKTPIKVRCTGTTAVVGAISDNSLHMIATATEASYVATYQSRIRFTG